MEETHPTALLWNLPLLSGLPFLGPERAVRGRPTPCGALGRGTYFPALHLELFGSSTRSLSNLCASFANLQESWKGLMMAWKPQTRSRLEHPVLCPGYEKKHLRPVSENSHPWVAQAAGWRLVDRDSSPSRLGPLLDVPVQWRKPSAVLRSTEDPRRASRAVGSAGS